VIDARLPAGIRGGFTTRAGGVSRPPWHELNLGSHVGDDPDAVAANRRLLAGCLGVPRVGFPEQIHGAEVAVVTAPRAEEFTGVDSLVTAEAGVGIGVLVADCMPVLLADPANRVVGVAHAGRRGLAAGVLQNTIAAMVGLGAESDRITAVVGPAVCGRCYEVPAEMRAAVDAAVPGTAATTDRGTPSLDLSKGAVSVIKATGVAEVRVVGICTVEDDRFYSYRRDGETGRFAGVVMLADDD